jgi:hypothetical protein
MALKLEAAWPAFLSRYAGYDAAVSEERRLIDEFYRHIVNAVNAHIFFGELTGVGAFGFG